MQNRNSENIPELLDDLRREAEWLRKSLRDMSAPTAGLIRSSLMNFVQNEFPRRFETSTAAGAFDNAGNWQGIKRFLSLCWFFLDKERQRRQMEGFLTPVCKEVNDYIRKQLYDWQNQLSKQLNPFLTDMERELSDLIDLFDRKLDRVTQILACEGEAKTGQLKERMWTAWLFIPIGYSVMMGYMPDVISPVEIAAEIFSAIRSGGAWHRELMNKIGSIASGRLAIMEYKSEADIRACTDRYFEERSSILYETALSLIAEAEQNFVKSKTTRPARGEL